MHSSPISISDCNTRPRTFFESAEGVILQSNPLRDLLKRAVGTEIVMFSGDAEPTSRELGRKYGNERKCLQKCCNDDDRNSILILLDEARRRIRRDLVNQING